MRAGRVEQVATPEEVYRHPATRFVAQFIGDNNLFEGTVEGDRVRIEGTDVSVPLPAGADEENATSVTVGIRPEAVTVGRSETPPADAGAVQLSADVQTAEFLGDAYRLHCVWEDRELLVKTGARDPPDGTVSLVVDPADVWVL